ncbi:GNAT family N-acetyltransferase [Candidatus Woesearchaeota archaeon]|nr:GNAT family N-acetyltransferase [Candidatus Woesearchaeota archaeon]
MVLDLLVRAVTDERELKKLRGFLLSQALWYPDYERWVEQVCLPDIQTQWKTAFVAYSNGHVVGDIIFQPHKQLPQTREIKNIRIHPRWRRRDLAHFLLRQVEETDPHSFARIMVDADTRVTTMINFLTVTGYRALFTTALYSQHNQDTVFAKEFPAPRPYEGILR